MAIHTEQIQKLYVAYFNRPADYEGLIHWEKVLVANKGDVQAVSRFFADSAEYKDQNAGKTNLQIVNQIYNNLFNRDADTTGLLFWAARLSEGTFTVDHIVKVIADSASDTDAKDKTTYANKVAAATAFSAELNTAPEIIGYSGPAANAAAKTWLSTIGNADSLAAATQPAVLQATVTAVARTGGQGPISTLTKGLDNFTGTAGSDTFVASIDSGAGGNLELNTLSNIDIINGGTGTDYLKIQHASGAITLGNLSNVEIVQIDSAATGGVTVDSSNTAGVLELSILKAAGVIRATAGAGTDVSLAARELGGTVAQAHAVNGGKNVTVTATDMGAASFADTITVGAATAASGNVVVNVAGQARDAGGSYVLMGAIEVKGGATITVNQSANTSTTAPTTGKLILGAIDVASNASTSAISVRQSASAGTGGTPGTPGTTTKGVDEVASVKFGAMKAGDAIALNGLTFTAIADMSGAEVASAFSNLTGVSLLALGDTQSAGAHGKGTYSGAFKTADWTSGAASGDTVVFGAVASSTNVTDLNDTAIVVPATAPMYRFTNTSGNSTAPSFTIVQGAAGSTTGGVGGGGGTMSAVTGAVAIDASSAAALKTVSVDGYTATGSGMGGAGSTGLHTVNLMNGGDFTVGAAADTLALNLTKVNGDFSLAGATRTLNLTSNGGNTADLKLGAVTTLNLSGTGMLEASGSAIDSVATIKVSGSAGLYLSPNIVRAGVTSVDTTGTTGSTTIAINGSASYAGGAGVDYVRVFDAGSAIGKSIDLGAGSDILDLTTAGAIAIPTVDLKGGDGQDSLFMSAANAVALSASTAFGAKIDGFETLFIDRLLATGAINLRNLDDIKHVVSQNSAGSTATKANFSVTLTGGLSNTDTLSFNGATVTANADMSAADMVLQLVGKNFTDWVVKSASGNTISFEAKNAGALEVPANSAFVFQDSDATVNTMTAATSGTKGAAAGVAAALTIDNLANGGTLELIGAGSGAIVNIAGAATGTADVLNVKAGASGNLGTVTANEVETVNLTSNGDSTLTVAGNAATAINVSGEGSLSLQLAATTLKLTTVNASAASGDLTLNLFTPAARGPVTVTGGSGNDVLTASGWTEGVADVLNGGAGSDTLYAGSNGARLTGGAGNDLFVLDTMTKEANTYSSITDFSAGDLLQLWSWDGYDSSSHTGTVGSFARLNAQLNETTSVFSNYVDAAIAQAEVREAVWFYFKGSSYVVVDNNLDGTAFENMDDAIIQLLGVDLSNASFNSTYGTVALA